jgi:hypothetical protein
MNSENKKSVAENVIQGTVRFVGGEKSVHVKIKDGENGKITSYWVAGNNKELARELAKFLYKDVSVKIDHQETPMGIVKTVTEILPVKQER